MWAKKTKWALGLSSSGAWLAVSVFSEKDLGPSLLLPCPWSDKGLLEVIGLD